MRFVRFVLLMALGTGLCSSSQAQPVTIPYKDIGSGFTIEVQAAGKTYNLMLGSCWSNSFASVPDLLRGQVPLTTLGGTSIGTVLFQKRNILGADGALGMDALRWLGLGFDLFSHQVTIWPSRINDKDALAWVSQAGAWSKYVTGPVTIPLTLDSEDLPTVDLNASGVDYVALLMTMTNGTAVFGDRDVAAESTVPGAFIANAQIGPETIPWLRDSKTMNGGRTPYPKLRIGATLAVEDFLSPRILVDFIGRKIYVDRLSPLGRATMVLDGLFRAPLVMTETGIEIGGPVASQDESMGQFDGWKVTKIDETPELTVRKMIQAPTAESQKALNGFLATIWKGFKIHMVGPDGTEGEIPVAPLASGG